MIFYYKKISKFLIKEILDKTNLLNLIKSKISVKKVGNSFFSLCPFHKERKPSFSINKIDKFYYCFGCGISGNSIKFLMDFNKLSFIESIKELSLINNINIDLKEKNINNKNIKYIKLLEEISHIYYENLRKKFNEKLKTFFIIKKWSFSIIKKFNIGYSSNNIISNLFINNKEKLLLLEKLSIIKKINNKYIDILNNRIIFPISNNYGDIISFGGRTLINDKYKYINCSNNFLFKKRYTLYGLDKILNKNNFVEKLLIVEGYSDVISLTNFGINFSIASLGTSLTYEHIKIIFKITNNIIFCYDSDIPGIKSYYRILIKIINFITDEKVVKFIKLPNNEDPDSFIRKFGVNEFNKFINNSKNFYDLLFEFIKKDIYISDINGKIKFIKKILFYTNRIPGNLTKKLIKKELISKLLLTNRLNLLKVINYNFNYKKHKLTILQKIISLLLQNIKLYRLFYIPYNIKCMYFNFKLLINIVDLCKKNNNINFNKIIYLHKYNYLYSYLYFLYKIDDNIINYKILDEIFLEILNKFYILFLKKIQKYLIYKSKKNDLNKYEKKKIWLLNIELSKLSL
ncbi:DNA primase [endosymbiont of Pachyrhynchus infernalis]|uniref:DNA primase n=1 Tax=endosymbiont of Pachyrhynchus infernalis TaxID=1971488 RepID=UPI000DC723F7|nr:DNA primase [endosymbiont of Pachyrhynchus infernalis]BBA84910.1 DNA primase [endosymbiont of Pachyrhynchus infernalis]